MYVYIFKRLKAALHYTVGRVCEKTGELFKPQDFCFSNGSVHVHRLNDRKANRRISVFVINLPTTL